MRMRKQIGWLGAGLLALGANASAHTFDIRNQAPSSIADFAISELKGALDASSYNFV